MIANANKANPKIRAMQGVHGYMSAFKCFLTQEFMLLADQVPTAEHKSALADNVLNTGVVAALIFTMLTIAPGDVSDELVDRGVSLETSQRVFTFFSYCAMVTLIICVMYSLSLYNMIGECNNHDETVFWSQAMGSRLNLPYYYLLLGLMLFLISQFWLALTILPLAWVALMVLGLFLVSAIPLHHTLLASRPQRT